MALIPPDVAEHKDKKTNRDGGGSQELLEGLGFGNNLSILLLLLINQDKTWSLSITRCSLPFVFCLFSFICSLFCSLHWFHCFVPCIWLATFKLILFSFDKGPFYPIPPSIYQLICFTCLPIKRQQSPKSPYQFPKWVFIIKIVIFGVLLNLYYYKHYLSPTMLLVLYSFMYTWSLRFL